MKKVWVLVTLIVCGAAIIFGNIHWNQKISAQGEQTAVKVESVEKAEETQTPSKVLAYTANLPENVQAKIKKAIDSKEPVKLVIYGTSEVEGTWIDSFKKELTAAYGEDVFEVMAISTGNNSTRELVNEKMYEEINKLSPDILLFEAPMLKDNGNVGITNTLTNLEEMFESWQEANEGLVLMIQPSQPLYNATYYPSEVSQLEDFAVKNKFIYLNHWENWPELDNAEMKNYLNKDSEVNEKGFGVWADYLIGYFVAE
ncbi:hypothetical protein CJ195_14240 [Bacillus sp. UMB0899]|uniref:hypothetical protein n=1 Tax=Metabacillus schmidteae TaxID=2730405 RepID=UPI000C7FF690|nr:hypothetical protein [Metabacillus schmidteae]PMC36591.1 hypothetical protein CJ195_14240 [Bacillus sp. UMB0899]